MSLQKRILIPMSLLAVVATIILLSGDAFAGTSQDRQNGQLQVAGGIAMPSTSTAVFTNPAGMLGAQTSVVLDAAAPEVWDHGTYRAGVQGGGSSFGVAAGLESADRAQDNALNAYYGLAVGSDAFTLGVAGRTGISHSSGSNFNAGLLFRAGSNAKIGVTARGIDHGVNEWGVGGAFGLGSGVDLVVDASSDSNFDRIEVKPGIKVGSGPAALTISYGTGAREEFADGFSAGGSFQFASGSSLEIEYNAGGDLSKYFAALTLGF